MNGSPSPQVVVVLGMHRSGTSLVMRLLNLLGVSLGSEERLLPPVERDNPTGFWEHRDIVSINEAILEHLGGSWDALPDFPLQWEASSDLACLRERAKKLLDEEFSGTELCGWKDPRLSLTLPFWRTLVPEMRHVICLRNPVDAAHSLQARNGIPLEASLELWSRYTGAAIRNSAGQPTMFTLYDHLFEDIDRELARLARFIGRQLPSAGSELHGEIVAFVQEELRHHESALLDCVESPFIRFPEKSLYLAMSVCTSPLGETTSRGEELIAGLVDGYQKHMEELGELQEQNRLLHEDIRSRVEQVRSQKEQIRSQGEQIRSYEEEIAAGKATARELEAQIEMILNSSSWRVTAPLRALARYVRGLRSRVDGASSS